MKVSNILIDLRGSVFRIRIKYLHGMPNSLLGRIAGIIKDYNQQESEDINDNNHNITYKELVNKVKELSDEIEFVKIVNDVIEMEVNRTPVLFHYILDLYVKGCMHLPPLFCAKLVHEEMEFWGLSERKLVTCCWAKLTSEKEKQITLEKVQKEWGVA